jgi:hypothetical protein
MVNDGGFRFSLIKKKVEMGLVLKTSESNRDYQYKLGNQVQFLASFIDAYSNFKNFLILAKKKHLVIFKTVSAKKTLLF